ncbi:uncharacterized protein VTP21DRAFT_7606 [Calcarisporiella thermophila]|uniref:uncharacterized protein n=1 Tax=Calcarisporiella thermophila TaxID=911321 RepID=UPI00374426C9
MSHWDQDERRIFNFPLPRIRFFRGKQRDIGVYISGALFALGWWAFIDAVVCSSLPNSPIGIGFEDWVTGILSTFGMIIVNAIDKGRLHADSFSYSGSSIAWKARLFLFIGFALMAGGLAGSVTVLCLKYIVDNVPPPGVNYGIANVVQNGLIMLSTAILWVAQNTETEYSYNITL